MPPSLIGQTLGEFEVVRLIGQGGMGAVYEGVHPVLGKKVALKVLRPELSNDEESVARLLTEARAVNAIRHRAIIDIFAFDKLANGSCYFAMEYLDGEPFDVVLADRGTLEPGEVLALLDQTLDALDAAHLAGIIHRDIKPSNLFRVSAGRARPYLKLLDFGVAKLSPASGMQGPNTRVAMVLGTPSYMAPEQARGEGVTALSDLYSLGCVAFEMLIGEEPFPGANAIDTMYKHIESPVPSVAARNSRVPPDLDALIARMMAKEPADRPQSAADARLEVEALRQRFPDEGLFLSPTDFHVAMRSPGRAHVATVRQSAVRRRRTRDSQENAPNQTVMMTGTAAHPPLRVLSTEGPATPYPPAQRSETGEITAPVAMQAVLDELPMPRTTAPVPMNRFLGSLPDRPKVTRRIRKSA